MQLVINTFGASLKRKGERFVVRAGTNRFAVSAHKVRSILVTTAVHLSSDAVLLAVAHQIDIVFLEKTGDPVARIWPPRMGSTAAIRRRQLEIAENAEGLAVARDWIAAKLRAQTEFLDELKTRRPAQNDLFQSTIDSIASALNSVDRLEGTLDERRGTLLGLEGSAGRAYFNLLGQIVPEAFRFQGRSRRPALDGYNAMLNYAYGVLYSIVDRACVNAGLDPFLGFLHTDNYNKPSLVYDMIEPFRILADRATTLLFTGRRVKAEFFEPVPGGVALSKEGRAAFLPYYQERLEQPVQYPVQSKPGKFRKIKVRDTIAFEAHSLANRLLGRSDLPRIVETRTIWADSPSADSASSTQSDPITDQETTLDETSEE
jgi:CRISPR-associated protein Cas1